MSTTFCMICGVRESGIRFRRNGETFHLTARFLRDFEGSLVQVNERFEVWTNNGGDYLGVAERVVAVSRHSLSQS